MKNAKSILAFTLAAALATAAAHWRFSDSSHAMGLLNARGGKALHPFTLETGHARYALIITGKVLPPCRGNVRIALEGVPEMKYTIYNSEPVIRLDLHRRPMLAGNILQDLHPGDRLALWVVMQPQQSDAEFTARANPPTAGEQSKPALSFYATDNNRRLLRIPINFIGNDRGGGHGS